MYVELGVSAQRSSDGNSIHAPQPESDSLFARGTNAMQGNCSAPPQPSQRSLQHARRRFSMLRTTVFWCPLFSYELSFTDCSPPGKRIKLQMCSWSYLRSGGKPHSQRAFYPIEIADAYLTIKLAQSAL